MNSFARANKKNKQIDLNKTPLALELELLIANTEEPFVFVDPALKILAYNSKFEKIYFDFFSIAILKGDSILNYSQTQPVSSLKNLYAEVFSGQIVEKEMEFSSASADLHEFLVRYKPTYDTDKKITGVFVSITDITEKKQAQQRLKASEKRFRALLENNGDMISLTDKGGKILYLSPAFEKLTGFTLEAMREKTAFEIMHPDLREEARLALEELLANPGVPIPRKSRFLNKQTGTYIYVEGITTNLLADENVKAIVANFKDVTERTETQEKLYLAESRFRKLIEHNYDGIVLRDQNFEIIYSSASSERILGWTDADKYGQTFSDKTHPDDVEKVKENHENVLKHPGVSFPLIFRTQHKNGHYVWVERVMTNMLHDKAIHAIVANFRDITQKIEAELEKEFDHNNLQALINNTNDLMWSISRDGKLISSNRAFDQMVKHMSGNEVIKSGKAPTAGFPEEQIKKWELHYARAFAGESFTIIEHTNFQQEYWSEISFYPIHQGDEIIGTACYSRNITERKLFERKLEENTERLLEIKKQLEHKEARLNQAQAIARVGNWELNLITKISIGSDEAYRIHGLEPTTDRKLNFDLWKTFIHPEDLPGFEIELKKAHQTFADMCYEYRIVRPDGTIRYVVSETRYELDAAGIPIGLYGVVHDVTEQKGSEKKIKESHQLLKKLTDKVPVAVYQFEMDAEGKMSFPFMSNAISEINPSIDLYTGDAAAIFKSASPEDLPLLISSIQESRLQLSDWSLEFRIILEDGSIKWLRGFSKPEQKENGLVVWYGYLQDVTERKLAEEKIRQAKERYDVMAKATNEAVWEWDLHTNGLHWGEGFTTLFGYKIKNGYDTIDTWKIHLHPDDSARVNKSIMNAVRSNSTLKWEEEYRYVKADGSYADILDRGYIIRDKDGKPERMIGAMQDITERKLADEEIRMAKERYDFVAKATNDAIYDWDLITNKTLRTGDGLKTLFGYDPEVAAAEKNFWTNRMHPEDYKRSYGLLKELLLNPDANYCNQEYRFKKADGTYAYVYDKGFIIRDSKGKAVRMIGATQDVTKNKEAEFKLKELNERLEKRAIELALSNIELEQFAYIASHDLQEPLRMVTSFLTQLENKYKDQLDDRAKQYIHFATDGAVRMRRLILDLLEYSRVGKQVSIKVEIDTNDLVYEAVKLNRTAIEEKKALINWKNLPVIYASKTSLTQVFQNLIANALKYQMSGTVPLINISGSETDTHWQFSVSDNGIGIEERYFEKIFVVFQRLHNKDEYSGTGIGLAICKKIVESNNGKMWVESTYGKGSTFYFTISKNTLA